MDSYGVVKVGKDDSGRITISFHYDPHLVSKVKTIDGRKWHPAEKYWSFPDTDDTLEKIIKVFDGEKIHLDPALQARLSPIKMPVPVIAMDEVPKQSHIFDSEIPTLAKGGLESGLSQRRPRCATPPIIGSADACPMSLRDTAAAPHPLSEMCRKI